MDKLQFTYKWFGLNWDYLLVVWNLTFYSPEVSKNILKYVILLYFYIFSLKNTKIKHKNTKSNKIKNNIAEHLHQISKHI